MNSDTVFIVNTQEEFAEYFPAAVSEPDNFTDYSLLFVYGKTTNKIVNTSYDIVPETDGTYRLDVDIELVAEQATDVWYFSILVPKIPAESVIPYKKTQGVKPDAVEKIENLKTRLRIVEPTLISPGDVEYLWRANPGDVIMNYPPYLSYEEHTYFGYSDVDGKVLLCKALNFPDSAKKWKGEFVYTFVLGTITEINVQMNGTVRLYTDEKGEKYGTLELTSLEPSGPESDEPVRLQPGVYVETYPYPGRSKFYFMDDEKVKREAFATQTFKYEICEDEYAIILDNIDYEGYISTMFFRVMNNSKFEIMDLYPSTAERTGSIIMTFEKENN
jgi:hypothetical protein